jgi:hypothetical protein
VRSLPRKNLRPLFALRRQGLEFFGKKATLKHLLYSGTGWALSWLWSWDWPLVLATGIGGGAMFGFYLLANGQGEKIWHRAQKFCRQPAGKLSLAVGGGVALALMTYLAAQLYQDLPHPNLAWAFWLQGVLMLLLFSFLLQASPEKASSLDWIGALGDRRPLQRLLAVRHLATLLAQENLERAYRQEIQEYFQLMLAQEEHPQVKKALLDSLKLQPLPPLVPQHQKTPHLLS